MAQRPQPRRPIYSRTPGQGAPKPSERTELTQAFGGTVRTPQRTLTPVAPAATATPTTPVPQPGGGTAFPNVTLIGPAAGLTINGDASSTQGGADQQFTLAFDTTTAIFKGDNAGGITEATPSPGNATGDYVVPTDGRLFVGTAGSVPFAATTTGLLAQDNARLFWDQVNHRLGVGTNAPSSIAHFVGPLMVLEDTANNVGWRIKSSSAGPDLKIWTLESDVAGGSISFRAVNDALTTVLSMPLTMLRDGSVLIGTTVQVGVAGGFIAHTGAPGITATITTAKLTGGGANGSMTFVDGILTAQTPAT